MLDTAVVWMITNDDRAVVSSATEVVDGAECDASSRRCTAARIGSCTPKRSGATSLAPEKLTKALLERHHSR